MIKNLIQIFVILFSISSIQATILEFPDSLLHYEKRIMQYYIAGDLDSAEQFISQLIDMTENNLDKKYFTNALLLNAEINSMYEPEKSDSIARKAQNIAIKIDYQKAIALSLYYTAAYQLKKSIPEAIKIFDQSIEICQKYNFLDVEALSKAIKGEAYRLLGNYESALNLYLESKVIFDQIIKNDSSLIVLTNYGSVINSLGIIYKTIENYEDAIVFQKEYLILSKQIGDTWSAASAYNNMGNIYKQLGDYKLALKNLFKALEIFRELEYEHAVSQVYMNIANNYLELNELDQAEEYYSKSEQIALKLNYEDGLMYTYASIGEFKLFQSKFKSAIDYFKKSLELSKKLQMRSIVSYNYDGLSRVFDSLKDYKSSLIFFKRHIELKDSLINLQNAQKIAEIKTRYEIENQMREEQYRKEQQRKLSQQKLKRRNLLQYFALAVFFIILFAFILLLGKFKVSMSHYEGIIFIACLLLFEFIMILIEHYIDQYTHEIPLFKFAINIIVVLILTPFNRFLETRISIINKTPKN